MVTLAEAVVSSSMLQVLVVASNQLKNVIMGKDV